MGCLQPHALYDLICEPNIINLDNESQNLVEIYVPTINHLPNKKNLSIDMPEEVLYLFKDTR